MAFLAAIEGLFFLFGTVSMHGGNPYRFYSKGQLDDGIAALLPTERNGSATGWPQQGEFPLRAHPDLGYKPCGSAWGGSFTLADEVADADAWPQVLSNALGCQVNNRGVNGFGLDQTLLHYRAHGDPGSFTILGLASPMIIIDAVSSITFLNLNPDKSPQANPTKPRFIDDGGTLRLIPRPEAEVRSIANHILSDASAADWEPLTFPFTFHAMRAIWYKKADHLFADLSPNQKTPAMQALAELAGGIVAEMARAAAAQHSRFVILLLPSPDHEGGAESVLFTAVDGAAKSGACVIDPSDDLLKLGTIISLRTANGHFNTDGNKAIAAALARGLRSCGITT